MSQQRFEFWGGSDSRSIGPRISSHSKSRACNKLWDIPKSSYSTWRRLQIVHRHTKVSLSLKILKLLNSTACSQRPPLPKNLYLAIWFQLFDKLSNSFDRCPEVQVLDLRGELCRSRVAFSLWYTSKIWARFKIWHNCIADCENRSHINATKIWCGESILNFECWFQSWSKLGKSKVVRSNCRWLGDWELFVWLRISGILYARDNIDNIELSLMAPKACLIVTKDDVPVQGFHLFELLRKTQGNVVVGRGLDWWDDYWIAGNHCMISSSKLSKLWIPQREHSLQGLDTWQIGSLIATVFVLVQSCVRCCESKARKYCN